MQPASTTRQPYFVSYSREQLYFTESLVFALHEDIKQVKVATGNPLNDLLLPRYEAQREELPLWFDLQQLTPGTPWKPAIEAGLQNCKGLILVASRSALASPYVRHEWETVQAAGKPVYVVWCEPVPHLPDNLRPTASFDLSSNFSQGVRHLKEALKTGLLRREAPPPIGRFNLPIEMPVAIAKVAQRLARNAMLATFMGWVLIVSGLWGLANRNNLLIDNPASILFFSLPQVLIGAGFLWLWYWRFLTHKMHYNRLIQVLMFLPFWWLYMFFVMSAPLSLVFFDTENDSILSKLIIGFVVLLPWSTILIAIWLFVSARKIREQYINSADMFRWLPKGSFSVKQRQRMNTSGQKIQEEARQVKYRLYHKGEAVARQLDQILQSNKHQPAQTQPDYHLFILSEKTDPAVVNKIIMAPVPFIPILISNFDVLQRFPQLEPYQIVDYRRRETDLLNAVARYLSYPTVTNNLLGLSVSPEHFTRFIIPTPGLILERWLGVGRVQQVLVGTALVCAVIGSCLCAAVIVPRNNSVGAAPSPTFDFNSLNNFYYNNNILTPQRFATPTYPLSNLFPPFPPTANATQQAAFLATLRAYATPTP